MIVTTKAIVLSALKYGDSNLIVKCFTQEEGTKSYLLKGILSAKKKKHNAAYFRPLTQLKIVVNHNSKGNLNSIREVELINHYNNLYEDIYKQSIVLFLSEMLNQSIKEEEQNTALFKYLELSFIWLDEHSHSANFHLLFLLNLTKYLGFYPELENSNFEYFDLVEGQFSQTSPKYNFITSVDLIEFKKLLGINFDKIVTVKFNSKYRQRVLTILIQYYELHLSGFRKPKSLEVLKSIFH